MSDFSEAWILGDQKKGPDFSYPKLSKELGKAVSST